MTRAMSAAYHRDYRARRRSAGRPVDAGRSRHSRAHVPLVTFTDALMILVAGEIDRIGLRGFARAALVDHSTISRWMGGSRIQMLTDTLDGLVEYFGIERVRAVRAEARRILREDPESEATRLATPGPFLEREVRTEHRHPWRGASA